MKNITVASACSYRDCLLVRLGMRVKALQVQPVRPLLLVQVQEHLLLQLVLPVVDADGIVVPVQAVNEGLQDMNRCPRLDFVCLVNTLMISCMLVRST
jgi:hypothetical protein